MSNHICKTKLINKTKCCLTKNECQKKSQFKYLLFLDLLRIAFWEYFSYRIQNKMATILNYLVRAGRLLNLSGRVCAIFL